ncbi:MAG: amidohydrolase [Leptospira sp.]|nr:amidohydrolase [Leptospira sp.]
MKISGILQPAAGDGKMKVMRYLLIFSVIANFFLLIFLIPSLRIKLRFIAMNSLGFPAPGSIPQFKNDILLTEYNPVPVLKTEDARKTRMPSMDVIETHGHIGGSFSGSPSEISKAMTELKIKKFINLSFTTGDDFKKLKSQFNDPRIIHFSTFNWKRIKESKDFVPAMLNDLKQDIANGTKGIKLWKNFGLNIRKENGERLTLDDALLEPLFLECEKAKLVISIHTADPPAFFGKADEKNERYEELLRHPEWSFNTSEFPKFEEVTKERERLFKKYPRITFVSLHFAEFSHDLEQAAKLLDSNKNVYLDIAARIDELGRQPYKTKEFLAKYQDRVFFGTDGPPDRGKFEIYSRFLETNDEYFDYFPLHKPRKGFWKIYGLGLKKEILEKIYFKNAEKVFR